MRDLNGAGPRRASLASTAWVTALLSFLVILFLRGPALAQQDPCAENGSDCRVMTAAEIKALKDRFLALRAALPVPDPARYAVNKDVTDAYTMPFVAETNIPGAVLICNSWPAGAFTARNDVSFPYDRIEKGKESDIGARIEVLARLFPHPYLVDNENGKCIDVSDPEAINIEKTATFLSWQSSDGTILRMVFGPRSCKEAETLRLEKPAKGFAPVQSIEIEIVGPEAEVATLKQKIDRKALEALLGPVVK